MLSEIPSFQTVHLKMRGHAVSDFDHVRNLWGDPRVTHFIGAPQTPEESWSRLLRYAGHWGLMAYGYWVVEEKASGDFVGEVGLANFRRTLIPPLDETPEVGWVVAPDKQGSGYATEAVLGALTWARRNMGEIRVACIIRPDHQSSINIAEKCGFLPAGKATYKGLDMLVFERWL